MLGWGRSVLRISASGRTGAWGHQRCWATGRANLRSAARSGSSWEQQFAGREDANSAPGLERGRQGIQTIKATIGQLWQQRSWRSDRLSLLEIPPRRNTEWLRQAGN